LENQESLSAAAREVLRENGAGYSVRLEVGKHWFPEKASAGGVLPAGRYNSVRVVLGQGQGQNWWCILFPPLCFVAEELTPEETQALIAEAGALITEQPPVVDEERLTDIEYEVRFKFVEWAKTVSREHPRLYGWLTWLR
jgi:stage II sporulation protein R